MRGDITFRSFDPDTGTVMVKMMVRGRGQSGRM